MSSRIEQLARPLPEAQRHEHADLLKVASTIIDATPALAPLAPFERARLGAILVESAHGLRLRDPQRSAARVLGGWQRVALWPAAISLAACALLAPGPTLQVAIAIATFCYLAAVAFRLLVFTRGIAQDAVIHVSDDEARAIGDDELPTYTVLVPAYDEPHVVGNLVATIAELEYPRDKLDVKLLLEADDQPTIDAALSAGAGAVADVVLVPPMEPRTKPKACNYGLLLSSGEITTIYDAEDIPDPLQLRRAAIAFRRLGDEVACIQARLTYHNSRQNLITRWFTSEYGSWFMVILPGLVTVDAPIPLGGTSNHIRTADLIRVGGWDPYNVTEDADLGIRLYREGLRSAVLDSATLEEANSDGINWIKQRSRWLKGYLQTWLVHMRAPRTLWRELGPAGFVGFNLMVGGTPLLTALNPLFWLLALIWVAGHPSQVQAVFPAWNFYGAGLSLVIGNACTIYMNVVAARLLALNQLLLATLLSPIYWAMMSIAAIKAIVQLVTNPSYWEKTAHGLDHPPAAAATAGENA